MQIDTQSLRALYSACEVLPGNVYPGQGGKSPRTEYWLVVAVTGTGLCHLLGLNGEGEVCRTASYYAHALQTRPILGRVDLSKISLSLIEQPEGDKGGAL